ncbi:MAG: acyltransferase [Deltaproteobacteria bacterium]|nr:MAG: acyltransferase [Deltaproteobacteria bacterium]
MLRIAVTQTHNAFASMPAALEGLPDLEGRLEDIRAANVEHHITLVKSAASQGAAVIGFGELFTGPYFALTESPIWRGLAEDAWSGPTVTRLSEAAREHGMVIIAPIYEKDRATGSLFNTAVVIEKDGQVLGTYRKTHIPDGANEKATFSERYYYGPSDGKMVAAEGAVCSSNAFFPVFQTSAGRIGVTICYDRHFEGVVAALAAGGAQVVFSPAVTFGEKSRRMWRSEFAVDAARHNVFIAGSNRIGAEPPWNIPFFGDSHVVGPNGPLEDQAAPGELVIADLDLDVLEAPDPAGWRLQVDRRPDLFGG